MDKLHNYKPVRDGDRWTIGESRDGCVIVNDICTYLWWDTEEEAAAAADAYNLYGAFVHLEGRPGTGLRDLGYEYLACDYSDSSIDAGNLDDHEDLLVEEAGRTTLRQLDEDAPFVADVIRREDGGEDHGDEPIAVFRQARCPRGKEPSFYYHPDWWW